MAVIQYRIGTVSVTAGATEIVGSGGMDWTTVAQPLDSIAVNGRWTKIMEVVDANHITIEPWPYTTQTEANYVIVTDGLNSFAAPEVAQAVVTLAENLAIEGTYVFVPDNATAPLPYRGDDGQYALQPSTGKLWYKSGGVWSYSGIYKALGTPTPYNSATTYKLMDVATRGGSSYVYIGASPSSGNAPPNATYWAVLAAKGDTGATGNTGPAAWNAPVAWLTGQSYTAVAPASVVTRGGETYVCVISHSSGTFSADLAANKWLKIAAKGADGNGVGDMLKGDNLAGLANVSEARANLGATTVGSALFTAADAAAARNAISALKASDVVSSVGGQIGAITLAGGGMATTELPVARFDFAQMLSTAEKRQHAANVAIPRTVTVLTSGSGTYTTPTGCLALRIRMVGGGGGGQGSGTSPGNGGNGVSTTFGTLTAGFGAGGWAGPAIGGFATGGDLNLQGANGGGQQNSNTSSSAHGASGPFGGAGASAIYSGSVGGAAKPNTGSGGSGATYGTGSVVCAGPGAAGGYLEKLITSPAATYSYSVGAGGAAGTAGSPGLAGGTGGSGVIIIEEFYQ